MWSTDTEQLWQRVQALLKKSRSDTSSIVKLNLYAISPERLAVFEADILERFPDTRRPAVCAVVTPLPNRTDVALDFVAAGKTTSSDFKRGVKVIREDKDVARILPEGKRIYISGQAARDENLRKATEKTLEGLLDTLRFLNRETEDVVAIKVFLTKMHDGEYVQQAVTETFGKGSEPPIVFVQWQSSQSVPVEIELIGWGGAADQQQEVVEYLTPPNLSASPVFSRVCRINHGKSIYLSGLSAFNADANQHVVDTFGLLENTLALVESSSQYLVKATYYVTDGEISSSLGQYRPKVYNPKRPPAASKATVPIIGSQRQRFLMDMIAVPALDTMMP
tara:strand:- start:2491 stop:3498 length:1008 start_codon:yes stop_codon:yes gene_type:complete